ncbi:potassium/proton antiporter [Shewanella sp. 1_MG-2023]|uniref:Potassium/proton antiporter n=1 Tax=Shewanella electrodiphila TaxID=934143 RepID=A0ABT0KUY6_9GAMM|nr:MULTISPECIES: potassium/proton antiporter [Shewanella]MCC4833952.1 potassium/proton antiporter [Shewanella sp. 10N.7]MCL1047647.1 potassium/proton antiporter [Shewanella electrodiphila]MDO6613190.1 potassium/proton antiporter [Shewanella sp. 7_MG-2023]MDO6773138.1 potassium/proton antiporter [Shewanella sp. 2_MG-2023]MDO6795614.1 potassium/proton antiporter [Shewanella sp. 1_MG-2023]
MTTEMIMIGMSILIVIGILLHHPSRTLGIPSLFIFMGVGLSLGNGEFNFVYDNLDKTAWIGGLALNVIVFVGGLNTSTAKIKVAYKEGGVLASFGVVFTTIIFAAILYLLLDFNFITCLLFAAVVSSTDAAAVFSILESKKLKLKEETDTVLEFESATNDPVAMLMVIVLTEMALSSTQSVTLSSLSLDLVTQILVAVVVGFLIGKIAVTLLSKISLSEYGLIPVFVLASFIIATYGAELMGGNILLASYIAGVVIGNGIKRGQQVNLHFFNSLSWLAQALMFIVLGLQIFPQTLMTVFWASIIPGLLLIFVARPLAVQLCYLPFVKATWKKRLFISMIGLKGATPIVFALIPAAAGVPGAIDIVHMVFFFVLFSIFIQGGAIAPLAKKLGLEKETPPK